MSFIDLNCDLGEGATVEDCHSTADVMPYISSCNIACGGHAGNAQTMKATLMLAKQHGLLVGAHPSYPDVENFGRQVVDMPVDVLVVSLQQQVTQLETVASSLRMNLTHIKFHGALYNQVEKDNELALALASWLKQSFPHLWVVGLAQGRFLSACQAQGLTVRHEAFIDRAYLSDGRLVPREEPGAVFNNVTKMSQQALQLALESCVTSIEGKRLKVNAQTLCLHGDTPNAFEIAKAVSAALIRAGFTITGCDSDT